MLPVGIGVLVGVAAVSNVLHWFLHHHRKATLGVLIGLLLGSVVGLWPFQSYVEPTVGVTVIKGRLVTEENISEFDREDWPTQWFRPTGGQVASSLALIGLGLGITLGVAALGGSEDSGRKDEPL